MDLSWLSDFIKFFGSLFPHLVVMHENERGVRFRRGKRAMEMSPGCHWVWPIVTSTQYVTMAQQALEIETMTLMAHPTDLSNKWATVIVGCVVVFKVTNVRKFLVDTADSASAITEVAGGALRKVVIGTSIDQLQNGLEDVDNKLMKALQRELDEYGVVVSRARLTNLSTAKVINCVGGQQTIPFEDE